MPTFVHLRCACGHEATLRRALVGPAEIARMRCEACGRLGRPKVVAQGHDSGVNAMAGANQIRTEDGDA